MIPPSPPFSGRDRKDPLFNRIVDNAAVVNISGTCWLVLDRSGGHRSLQGSRAEHFRYLLAYMV